MKAACEGLLNLAVGDVELVTDAVAAVDAAEGARVIAALRDAGVRLIRVADVLD